MLEIGLAALCCDWPTPLVVLIAVYAYLISLLGSPRTQPALQRLRDAFPDWHWIVSSGVRVQENRVRYEDMREMECYRNWTMVSNGYPVRALGCRLAGLQAITLGVQNAIANGDEYFGIFQDDATPVEQAREKLQNLLLINEGHWDCLWLDQGQLTGPKGVDGRLGGARLCTGMIVRTSYALDLIQRLTNASCEWDVWMEQEMKLYGLFYGDDIVFQAAGESEITGRQKWKTRDPSGISEDRLC